MDVAFDSGFAFAFDISIGVRKTDGALGDDVQEALDRRTTPSHATLTDYGVPLIERE